MKILYLITKGNFGGAQRYVYDLAVNFHCQGESLTEVVVAFGEGQVLERKLKEKGVRTIRLQNAQRDVSILKDIKLFFELLKLFKKEKPDIVHLNSSKIGALGAFATRLHYTLQPKPYTLVFTAHGWAFNDSKFLLSRIVLKFIQWLTIILSHKTIAVSQSVKKDFAGWPFVSKKIKVIYNGIKLPEFLTKEEAREKLLPEKKDRFWIGTVSELHKNKGLDILIKSAAPVLKNNSNAIVVIIGEGEERENLLNLIKNKGIEEQVFFLGFVENAARYLKALDIFTLTSRTEGLPYVLLEAGFAEVPVIATRVGGIPEIIDEKFGTLVEKGNIEGLSQKINKLTENVQNRLLLGEKLKEKITNDFSLEKMITETLSVYR